jgi:hypothetical protein
VTWYSVGAVGFVLTRDQCLARFPKRPGLYKGQTDAGRFRVTQVWVTDHDRWQLVTVQYTALP